MASGFFALFDDIAALMDDMATMSKVATKKTAGILGDDLAVTAEQASGFASSRELPVLWAIAKGSLVNKLIILPIAFLLSAFAPYLIGPILMLGGLYLAYEGAEKIYEYFFHKTSHEGKKALLLDKSFTKAEILAQEKKKIDSAIRTDFILSIEIVVIALGTVTQEPLLVQIGVVSLVAVLATVGVYGFVALLVRMDDFGYKLVVLGKEKGKKFVQMIGGMLVKALPKVIKALGVIGTLAMLLVAGGIFIHHIPTLHEMLHAVPSLLAELLVGLVAGALVLAPMELYHNMKRA